MRIKLIILIIAVAAATAGVFAWQKKHNAQNPVTPPPNVNDFVDRTFVENRAVENSTNSNLDLTSPSPSSRGGESSSFGEGNKTENGQIAGKICDGTKQSDFDCYQTHYQSLVKSQGIAAAFADLRQRYNENSYVSSQCHPLTHVIGNEAAKKYSDVGEAYKDGDSFCWSGYYHGVLEGIIGRIGLAKLTAEMDSICKSLAEKSRYSFDHYNCVHGLGHGVMAIYDNELFKSLEACDAVKDTWERQSCWSGAFMENVIVDNKYHFAKYLKPEDPLYPCNAVGGQYRATCYLMQTSYMLKVTNGDFNRVFELCSSVEDAHRTTCYQSLGRDVSGRSLSNTAQTKQNCSLGKTEEQREHCVIGAVKDFISYLHSDTRAKELCNSFEEEKIKTTCLQTAESYYKLF